VKSERKNIFFYHFGFVLPSPYVYKHATYMCDWERAQIPTQTSCYEGVFLFFDNSNCVYIMYISTFTFLLFFPFSLSLSSQQATFLSTLGDFFFVVRSEEISKYTCKRQKKKERKMMKNMRFSRFASKWVRERERTYIFHKAHSSFENLGRKEVWQLLWGGRSLKCWLSAFRFSFKYIGLFFMKMIFFILASKVISIVSC
jgi:hypothetical protein